MTSLRYKMKCASKALELSIYETPDGKLAQFLIEEDRRRAGAGTAYRVDNSTPSRSPRDILSR